MSPSMSAVAIAHGWKLTWKGGEMRRTIYTDGHSLDLSYDEAVMLDSQGLIESHPGAGSNGITDHDWKLADGVDWQTITDKLADFHHAQ